MLFPLTEPKLSVVVICYNMARELPRTIKSMSPAMQTGLAAADYELIVIDNGSTQPFSIDTVLALAPNLSLHRMERPTVSPVPAINFGISLARGDLIGVCIDGARMASPGLFAAALTAAEAFPAPIIGTIAFHLGPDVQMRSILNGYNQSVEDALLASSGWEDDGYKLFDISAFAGSSSEGWFITPSETNALFMRSVQWRELGGYDEQFVTPGGGLANLDMWLRAGEHPGGDLVMVLGEATFHQIHGGIATNNPISPWETFHDEYVRIRGKSFAKSTRAPKFSGRVRPAVTPTLRLSVPPMV